MLASLLNSSSAPASIPAPEVRKAITDRLSELVEALEGHSAWTPTNPPRSLFFIWDFVKRSHYIMTELDNISNGHPIKHPEQIPSNNGATGERAAALSFQDVCTRSMTVTEMIQNPRMLVMLGLSNIDFNDDIRQRSRALSDAISSVSSPSS
ncbi:hypothetical protein B0J13DRAFT_116004 [Dactylonectria estremocensis]|uniref:Uncharacterized protein n=1 Tax=Dactylonectria estremocensis TaxID=1079267 RepID=A0A9P9FDN6_9HYPO|nr:hypothetical protein B0J13DRAFT_116004 [Dactylonectria estremocensis]